MAENSTLKLENVDGFLINKGTQELQQNFDDYNTHIEMCYECTHCQILEPSETTEDNYSGILICYDWKEN